MFRFLTNRVLWVAVFIIRAYQAVLSPILTSSCRFQPTCSEYMIIAIKTHGFKGILKGIKRLIDCSPFSRKVISCDL